VSWHRKAQKWSAYLNADGKRHYLGLFATAEEASAAYNGAYEKYRTAKPTLAQRRASLLTAAHAIYKEGGIAALSNEALDQHGLLNRLRDTGVSQEAMLSELGLTDEYRQWRRSARAYRGVVKPQWTWERAVDVARELLAAEGDLPTIPWCRLNGHSHLVNVVFQTDHTWEELRAAVGLSPSQRYFSSRSGLRWRSRPEACFSNFLYARGIEHKAGEPYPSAYAEKSGRARGRYDVHFLASDGRWIHVEIWGDLPHHHFGARYAETKAQKLAWHAGRADFLGISHLDCLSDVTLIEILQPYIGEVAPFRFDRSTDAHIETAHWSSADELLDTCRQIAASAPRGIFPSDEWLRKRGKFADRDGPAYNTVAIRVCQWLGGTRKVRELLGQSHANTIKWTREKVVAAWCDFENRYGLTPVQAKGPSVRHRLPRSVAAEASQIYAVILRLNVRDNVQGIRADVRQSGAAQNQSGMPRSEGPAQVLV
jgi:hypothetical protein